MTIKVVAQTILVAASIAIIPANLVGGAIQGQLGQSVHTAEIKNPQPEYGRIQNIPYLSAPSAAIYDYTAHSFVYSKQPFSWQYSASTSKVNGDVCNLSANEGSSMVKMVESSQN